jgi:hypothetical protein
MIEALDREEFRVFYAELCEEAKANNDQVTEEEARELFELVKGEYNEVMKMNPSDLDEDDYEEEHGPRNLRKEEIVPILVGADSSRGSSLEQTAQYIDVVGRPAAVNASNPIDESDETIDESDETIDESDETIDDDELVRQLALYSTGQEVNVLDQADTTEFALESDTSSNDIYADLRERLPTFSDKRIEAIHDTFEKSLTDPSLFDLVPLVRENMPDFISSAWLKRMSLLTSKFVVHKAVEEGVLDFNMMNGVLGLYASAGSLDNALKFHQSEFGRYDLTPNGYSDRLVFQMFLDNRRLGRALDFKQKIEQDGRVLDLKSYGSLIEYCSRRGQFGSALLFVKECVAVAGAPPGEAYLKHFRLLGRQLNVGEEAGIESLIGPDPFGKCSKAMFSLS